MQIKVLGFIVAIFIIGCTPGTHYQGQRLHTDTASLQPANVIPVTAVYDNSVDNLADSILRQWASRQMLKHAGIGVCFRDANTGRTIAEHNPYMSLAPASVLKLWTTATALEIMGPEYRFETKLAYSGEIKKDSLAGDLIIIGGGDPALGSSYFRKHYMSPHFLSEWVSILKRQNIRHITGNLVADVSIYDDISIPSTWIWEDIGNYYGAATSALSCYDNTFGIQFASPSEAGRQVRIITTTPDMPGLEIDNRVLSSEDRRDMAYVYGSPLDSRRLITGTIPKGHSSFTVKASVPDPPMLLAQQFMMMLEAEGITIGGTITKIEETDLRKAEEVKDSLFTAKAPRQPQYSGIMAVKASPALADIIRVTNHESVNLFAEHLVKHIAYMTTGVGNIDRGLKIITDYWKKRGVVRDGFFINDGSGLSRFNAITAEQTVMMLNHMKNKSPNGTVFYHSLPTVPYGTLYNFNHGKFPGSSLSAKSGSMTRVRCYAGQIRTRFGREILFSIMLNNFTGSQNSALRAIEDLLHDIYLTCQ